MTISLLLLGTRNPTIPPSTFKAHLESHVELIKRLTGDAFPLAHRRSYILRTTQSDFEFDSVAELTFEDQAALERFQARVRAPEAAKLLKEDEDRFSDRGRLCIVRLGEVVETRR
ncbi:hypothetical protein BO70DRAFT_366178 [Aspergillus heteromorphus CBS 117.55]|uniref:EthD domain-containing protein n=1 Tax=Aspergillus heteromorphus CBS 117.55 TaxID=1448321 RepID=A0A317V3G0_9EURO|nr:uncharacterized protein BO70DRAFT_366178 [Aspergillus heteromorphus CBS 117.55]PWY67881.1 hypothetical protein BO70DRAFT_366178 [Aspergillus heteromorphus CBS 117.55]